MSMCETLFIHIDIMRIKTWKIIEWKNPPEKQESIELECQCGHDAYMPISAELESHIIATFGMCLVTEPPKYQQAENDMPGTVQCRHCRRILTTKEKETADVR